MPYMTSKIMDAVVSDTIVNEKQIGIGTDLLTPWYFILGFRSSRPNQIRPHFNLI